MNGLYKFQLERPGLLLLFVFLISTFTLGAQPDTIHFQHRKKPKKTIHLTIGDFSRVDDVYTENGERVRGVIHHFDDSTLVMYTRPALSRRQKRKQRDSVRRANRWDEAALNRGLYTVEYRIPVAQIVKIRVNDYDYGSRKVTRKIVRFTMLPAVFAAILLPYPVVMQYTVFGVIYLTDYAMRTKRLDVKEKYDFHLP